MAKKLAVAQKGGSTMVVGVEEGFFKSANNSLSRVTVRTQRLFLEEEEACVDEFEVFCEIVELRWVRFCFSHIVSASYIVQNDQFVSPATTVVADGIEDSIAHDSRDQLLEEEQEQGARDDGQVKVVDLEGAIELKSRATTHDLTAAKDDDAVQDQGDCHDGMSGHWCAPGHEAELLGLVAHDGLETSFEDGP